MFKILKIWKTVKKINKWHVCMLSRLLCLTLCDPMDCSPPGSSVHGILQERILAWAAMPSSRESPQPRDTAHVSFSCIGRFFTTSATY